MRVRVPEVLVATHHDPNIAFLVVLANIIVRPVASYSIATLIQYFRDFV